MRADMQRIIVDRPRYSSFRDDKRNRAHNQQLENLPLRESMRKGRRPNLNDHLAPLRRYLAAQIGRPWNKVYSDICRFADSRSILGHHLREHARGYVHTDIKYVNGKPHYAKYGYELWTDQFYVDPNGLLQFHRRHRKRSGKTQHKKSKPLMRKPITDAFDTTLKMHKREKDDPIIAFIKKMCW